MQQPKLNRKHANWVEYLQSFTFVIKHISGQGNKVADALSRRSLVIQEGKIQVLGFEFMKELYDQDSNFQEVFEACKCPMHYDRVSGQNLWFNMVCYLETVSYVFLSAQGGRI